MRWGYKAWVAANSNSYAFYISIYHWIGGDKPKSNVNYCLGLTVFLGILDKLQGFHPTEK